MKRGSGRTSTMKAGYFSINDLLEHATTRALRALRFVDGATSEEVADALGIDVEKRRYFSHVLGKLRRHGFAVSDDATPATYSITRAGRDYLAGLNTKYLTALDELAREAGVS